MAEKAVVLKMNPKLANDVLSTLEDNTKVRVVLITAEGKEAKLEPNSLRINVLICVSKERDGGDICECGS